MRGLARLCRSTLLPVFSLRYSRTLGPHRSHPAIRSGRVRLLALAIAAPVADIREVSRERGPAGSRRDVLRGGHRKYEGGERTLDLRLVARATDRNHRRSRHLESDAAPGLEQIDSRAERPGAPLRT